MNIEERLERIEQILKDNKQHELLCPAHITAQQAASTGGMFFGSAEKFCDCWISEANPSTDPTKGFGIYDKTTEAIWQAMFLTRYAAVEHLVVSKGFSRDPKANNYHGKDFLIIEVALQPKEEDTP
jgi:hypothetical protein